jgi:hypothetical protein
MSGPDVRVDGVEYTPAAVADVRNQVILLRDEALKANNFEWAVLLSHAIVYLAEYALVLSKED